MLKEKDLFCEACKIAKNTRKQSKSSNSRAKIPLERICIDSIVVNFISFSGYKYAIIFTDDYSNYRWISYTKGKPQIYDKLKNQLEYFKTQYKQYPEKYESIIVPNSIQQLTYQNT